MSKINQKFKSFVYYKKDYLRDLAKIAIIKPAPITKIPLHEVSLHKIGCIYANENYTTDQLNSFLTDICYEMRHFMKTRFTEEQFDWFLKEKFLPGGGNLHQHNGDILASATDGGFIGIIKILIKHNFDVKINNSQALSECLLSGEQKHFRTISKLLIDAGAEIEKRAMSGFETAIIHCNEELMDFMYQYSLIPPTPDFHALMKQFRISNHNELIKTEEEFFQSYMNKKEKEKLNMVAMTALNKIIKQPVL